MNDVVKVNYERWLNSPRVDEKTKDALRHMSKEEISDAFFKDVEFGTAGMRGIIGPGTNRLNIYTVQKATIAFAKYLLEVFSDAKTMGVAISHDNRHMSREFTLESARILNDFGINTYIFDSLRPTPELSFAVRYAHACGGIMITASHNPKEYNGYKVYDEFGCQLVPDKISKLIDIIMSLPNELEVSYTSDEKKGTNVVFDQRIDDEYVSLVKQVQINADLKKKGYRIVFSPQHGTSFINAMRVFNECGYDVYPLKKQCTPDPDFSNTLSPNPEDPRAYIEPIKLAKEIDASLIVMTDPDGDRCGLAFKNSFGEYELLTGNQSASILLDYVLSERKKKNLLSHNGVIYNTIVTSPLGKDVASSYGVKTESFLTGFKFIGNRIEYYEEHGGPTFEFGYEESYGCLIKSFVRDKDATQAILLYSEMALFYHLQGKTLDVVYDELQKRLGYHADIVYSIEFKGLSGSERMKELMSDLCTNPIDQLLGYKVIRTEDYKLSVAKENGKEERILLPKSDVIKLFLESGDVVAIRPSGTEPKCKFYMMCKGKSASEANIKPQVLYEEIKRVLNLD